MALATLGYDVTASDLSPPAVIVSDHAAADLTCFDEAQVRLYRLESAS